MQDNGFLRVRISGLNLVAFLGLVMHVLMATFETLVGALNVVVPMNTAGASVDAGVVEHLGEFAGKLGSPGMMVMMFVFILLSLLIVVLPLIANAKPWRWATVVVGALLVLMNGMDGGVHIFGEGEVINGLYTLLVSGGVGLIATILAVKWAREPAA
jgi:hypothetical protein